MLISIIGRFDGFGSPPPPLMRCDSRMGFTIPRKIQLQKKPWRIKASICFRGHCHTRRGHVRPAPLPEWGQEGRRISPHSIFQSLTFPLCDNMSGTSFRVIKYSTVWLRLINIQLADIQKGRNLCTDPLSRVTGVARWATSMNCRQSLPGDPNTCLAATGT